MQYFLTLFSCRSLQNRSSATLLSGTTPVLVALLSDLVPQMLMGGVVRVVLPDQRTVLVDVGFVEEST